MLGRLLRCRRDAESRSFLVPQCLPVLLAAARAHSRDALRPRFLALLVTVLADILPTPPPFAAAAAATRLAAAAARGREAIPSPLRAEALELLGSADAGDAPAGLGDVLDRLRGVPVVAAAAGAACARCGRAFGAARDLAAHTLADPAACRAVHAARGRGGGGDSDSG